MRLGALRKAGLAAAVALLATAGVRAETYKGEVIQVQERVRSENGGEQQQLTIRTREREELRLDLGAAGACAGCVQVGDQVRVRTTARSAQGQALEVRNMQVERTNSSYTFRTRSGQQIPTQVRTRGGGNAPGGPGGRGDLDRTRDRDRTHAPGTGGGSGAGNRHGGGQG